MGNEKGFRNRFLLKLLLVCFFLFVNMAEMRY